MTSAQAITPILLDAVDQQVADDLWVRRRLRVHDAILRRELHSEHGIATQKVCTRVLPKMPHIYKFGLEVIWAFTELYHAVALTRRWSH